MNHPARQVSRVDQHWLNSEMRHLTVVATHDHLQGLVKTPLAGLVEVVWNALDADANEVKISVQESDAGGVEAVVIEDNGTGMTQYDAEKGFGGLGGSWKKGAQATLRDQRQLHGRLGQGRYAAYGIGERIVWYSVTEEDGKRTRIRLTGSRSNLQDFEIGDPEETTEPVGTRVQVTVPNAVAQTALLKDAVIESLTAEFALYLTQYEQVRILWNGNALDPKKYIERLSPYELTVSEDETVSLTVIEWTFKRVDRALFLCDAEGMTLSQVPPSIHAKDFQFTAYLKWQRFREMKHDILLADTAGHEAQPVLDAAREQLRIHFRDRAEERRKETIQRWHAEEVYPYEHEPVTEAEIITRETFDVVALAASRVINESKTPGKRLALNLMKEAVESSPSSLKRILQDVIGLSKDELAEFDALLNRTSLSNMLRASRVIGDRLDFLALLDTIIWEREAKKATLERDHLHKMLEQEPWVFGEEWSVSTSDQRLSRVLRAHLSLLGEDVSVAEDPNDPVLLSNGRDGRPDLVLWRAAEVQQNRLEHLVVELKRPKVTLGIKELNQIEIYADSVLKDTRFDKETTHWEFWIIGDEVDSYVDNRRRQQNMPVGAVQHTREYTIWVKLWSEILRDANHRHKFVQKNLDWQASRDHSVERMREKYAEMLPDVLLHDAEAEDIDTTEPEEVAEVVVVTAQTTA